jgi:hypothetical protein
MIVGLTQDPAIAGKLTDAVLLVFKIGSIGLVWRLSPGGSWVIEKLDNFQE